MNWQVNSTSNIVSCFIAMTHNSSVNFKLIHFLLWTKGSNESSNFETSECYGENLPNSSCHFLNHKLVFLQILHHSSVPWKIRPICTFLSQTLNTLVKRGPINSSSNFSSFFIVITPNSSVNLKLMRFLLRVEGSHQTPNFDTVKCSGKNFPNSSCHFANHRSFFFFKFCITLQCHER